MNNEEQPGKRTRKRKRRIVRTDGTSSAKNQRETPLSGEDAVRLNKYLARSGVASRRKADELIAAGQVTVNNQVVTEMGVKVNPAQDLVKVDGKPVKPSGTTYLLLNKPRNTITTKHDPKGRTTVFDLLKGLETADLVPAGRLDRDTTGLLLFTNDGELTHFLTHPSSEIRKLYHVKLDKPIADKDLELIRNGLLLEDGPVQVDGIDLVRDGEPDEVGIELHSGRNRVVRRIFEHLGYSVEKLDRVAIDFLTKRKLPRGKWRFLDEKEVGFLKMLQQKKFKAD